MSLTESVVDIALDEARKAGARRLTRIVIEIGALSSVEPEAMRFCFAAVAAGTPAEGVELEIASVEGAGWCADCGKTVPLSERFALCPDCGGAQVRVTAGDQMRIRELEVV